MYRRTLRPLCLPLTLCTLAAALILRAAAPETVADLREAFVHPPDDARIMMRWWWFGPSVAKPELERELRAMKQGGIGGFEVQPTYPLELDGNFSVSLRRVPGRPPLHRRKRRSELGLRFDLTLGSGWPFGGPHIPITEAADA